MVVFADRFGGGTGVFDGLDGNGFSLKTDVQRGVMGDAEIFSNSGGEDDLASLVGGGDMELVHGSNFITFVGRVKKRRKIVAGLEGIYFVAMKRFIA